MADNLIIDIAKSNGGNNDPRFGLYSVKIERKVNSYSVCTLFYNAVSGGGTYWTGIENMKSEKARKNASDKLKQYYYSSSDGAKMIQVCNSAGNCAITKKDDVLKYENPNGVLFTGFVASFSFKNKDHNSNEPYGLEIVLYSRLQRLAINYKPKTFVNDKNTKTYQDEQKKGGMGVFNIIYNLLRDNGFDRKEVFLNFDKAEKEKYAYRFFPMRCEIKPYYMSDFEYLVSLCESYGIDIVTDVMDCIRFNVFDQTLSVNDKRFCINEIVSNCSSYKSRNSGIKYTEALVSNVSSINEKADNKDKTDFYQEIYVVDDKDKVKVFEKENQGINDIYLRRSFRNEFEARSILAGVKNISAKRRTGVSFEISSAAVEFSKIFPILSNYYFRPFYSTNDSAFGPSGGFYPLYIAYNWNSSGGSVLGDLECSMYNLKQREIEKS